MPMADVFGILQFVPLAVTAGAALFLGAPRRMAAVDGDCHRARRCAHHRATWRVRVHPLRNSLLAVVSVLFSAGRDLLSRSVAPGISPLDHRHGFGCRRYFGNGWVRTGRDVDPFPLPLLF